MNTPGAPQGNFRVIGVLLAAIILYGSLYPFAFHAQAGAGALPTLLGTWRHVPGRGDFLSNILLYVPLGFFCFLATGRSTAMALRLGAAILCGFVLSLAVELLQYYDSGRDSELTDLCSNTIGAALGAALTLLHPGRYFGKSFRFQTGAGTPLLLLGAWAAYKLFPFVPVIDLHKYWHAIRPLLTERQISAADLARHFAMWTVCAAAIQRAANIRTAALWYLAFVGLLLTGKIFVVGGSLNLAEIAGAGLGLCLLLVLGRRPWMLAALSALLLAGYIVLSRLAPFQWLASPRDFGWIPFLSFMQGSINVDVLSFLEKFFLYGGLIWLLRVCGVRLRDAAMAVAILLLATSWAERYLPGRSAELTDALFAVLIGTGFALLDDGAASRNKSV